MRKEPSVPTPAILYHNFNKTIIDSNILIFECLQGQPLHNMKQEHANSFLEVQKPVLNHFDVWDGNVFVMQDGENCSVEAIIDCERAFYEDPLCDFVSSVNLFGDIRTEKDFLAGYYGTDRGATEAVSFSHSQLFRLFAYKLYLYLIMLVETAYRDSGSWLYKRFIRHHIRSGYGQARRYGEMVRA